MKRQRIDRYDGPTTAGIDVSRWQGEIDWAKVPADDDQPKFAICRTGDGRSRDRRFKENLRGARAVGLLVGSYHYLRADRDGATQADMVADMWEGAGGFRRGIDIPPALDLEEGIRTDLPGGVWVGRGDDLPLEVVVEESLEYLVTLENHFGARPIVYTGQAFHWWLSIGNPELAKAFEEYPLWIASYGRSTAPRMPVNRMGEGFPWETWTFWQTTGRGECDGIRGDVDVDYFRGDRAEFVQWIAATPSRCG